MATFKLRATCGCAARPAARGAGRRAIRRTAPTRSAHWPRRVRLRLLVRSGSERMLILVGHERRLSGAAATPEERLRIPGL